MTYRDFAAAILNRRMLICVFTGFASGLPLYILISLVPWDLVFQLTAAGMLAALATTLTTEHHHQIRGRTAGQAR